MKKLLTLLFSSLLLTSCGSDTSTSTTDSSTGTSDQSYFYQYITAEFTIDAPEEWEKINEFSSDYPEEIRVAFRNNIKDSDFTANVTVIREDNTSSLTNADWAQKKLNSHAETVLNYQLISQEQLDLTVSSAASTTLLNTFTGKNETDGPSLTFMQTYLTKGDKAWTITATYSPDEDPFVIQKMDTMLRSFALK